MGQQQLLLLVLGAIIVGLAIVVGINLFGQGALKANEDSVRQDILSMMSRVEEYYRKPAMLGGGGKSFAGLTSFTQLGYKYNQDADDNEGVATAVSGKTYTNNNGTYTLTNGTTYVRIEGQLAENEQVTVTYEISIDKNHNTYIAEYTPEEPAG